VAEAVVPVEVDRLPVRLGQFLQLAGIADTGADAKILLAGGEVLVDGEADVRRGRQLHPGDVVSFQGHSLQVLASPLRSP
jgi:ribosome-associated protein